MIISLFIVVPLAVGFTLVNIEQSPETRVFVNPNKITKNYLDDPGYQIGDKFWVYANISDVADLYTWHVKLSWNKDVLNGSQIVYGDFLAATGSTDGTSHTNPDVIATDAANITGIFNDDGYGWVAESVLGDELEVGVDGNGRLLAIELLIVGYGCSDINISISETLPTMLLDSTGGSIMFTTADGYFSNWILGDITGPEGPPDGMVDGWDMTRLSKAYGSTLGSPNWDLVCDITGPEDPPGSGGYPPDGWVDGWDMTAASKNYGRFVSI